MKGRMGLHDHDQCPVLHAPLTSANWICHYHYHYHNHYQNHNHNHNHSHRIRASSAVTKGRVLVVCVSLYACA